LRSAVSAHVSKERSDVRDQQVGLLERSEMAAAWHGSPMPNVHSGLSPGTRHRKAVRGERRDTDWYLYLRVLVDS
jgi:hypothetical protein